ncbi:sulfatase family protein [Maribellus sediminis]|uniref:sulfatase family protein n=1 Tax=Maribellus sediminis TaxID=2696285 RepID=UPI00142F88EE|nr:arylsulfatase [Maribellus sediminis]
MKRIVIFLIAAVLFGSCNSTQKENTAPNIVVILADDMGCGDVSGFNENSKINTPNIDQLVNAGVSFTDAHTSSAVCTPTRYSILTGRYNWRSTLKNGVLSGFSKALIEPDRLTLPGFLQEQGYSTAFIGKWHLGWDWAVAEEDSLDRGSLEARPKVDFSKPIQNGPNTRGFNYTFGFSGSLDMAPYVWVENDTPTMVPTKYTVNTKKQAWWRRGLTSDDFVHERVLPDVTDKTIAFIDRSAKDNQPFFIYMALPAPHTPILPSPEFQGKSGLDNPYGDFVMMVDDVVGKVKKALEENGVAENTIIIFTSDNGCSPQADFEQLATKGHDPSYVFRGHKADIFEGGHRVPFVVSWPDKIKQGKSDQLVCTTDIYATVADILKTQFPDEAAEDSYSFMSELGLDSDLEPRPGIVHHSINGSFAYREGNYKAIFCPGSGGWSAPKPNSEEVKNLPPVQLYDLSTDIAEENNIQQDHPEIIEQYRNKLSEIVRNGRSTAGAPQKNTGPESWGQLEWMNK